MVSPIAFAVFRLITGSRFDKYFGRAVGNRKKVRYGMPEFMLVASAHALMPLRAITAQIYCVLCSFLFFDLTRFFILRPHSERQLLR